MTTDADYDWIEDDDDDADWIKAGRWDLPADFRGLMLSLAPDAPVRDQKAQLAKLMSLPSWGAAPAMVKTQAARFLAGSEPVV